MYDVQSAQGEIPWSGPPFNLTGSDTYHLLNRVARELGNTLGVYAAVEEPGHVRIGDMARWLD